MSRDRSFLLGTAAAVVAATLFSSLGPLARFAGEAGVDGVAFTAWRAGLGAAFLALLIGARGRLGPSVRAVLNLPRRGRLALAIAALMGVTLNMAIFSAFGIITIALTLMLFYTYPAGVVLVDLALGRERMTLPRLAALVLSTVGVILVLAAGREAGGAGPGVEPLGVVLGLVAAAAQVVFVTVSRHGYRAVPADAATLVILGTAMVAASLVALATGQGDGLLAPFRSVAAWPFLLPAGIAAAGISSLLFLAAIRMIGGTRTGILMLLEPVGGALLAALLLHETLTPAQGLGVALVLVGALVLQVAADPEREPVAEPAAGPLA